VAGTIAFYINYTSRFGFPLQSWSVGVAQHKTLGLIPDPLAIPDPATAPSLPTPSYPSKLSSLEVYTTVGDKG